MPSSLCHVNAPGHCCSDHQSFTGRGSLLLMFHFDDKMLGAVFPPSDTTGGLEPWIFLWLSHHIGNVIISIDFIYFSEGLKPPTRQDYGDHSQISASTAALGSVSVSSVHVFCHRRSGLFCLERRLPDVFKPLFLVAKPLKPPFSWWWIGECSSFSGCISGSTCLSLTFCYSTCILVCSWYETYALSFWLLSLFFSWVDLYYPIVIYFSSPSLAGKSIHSMGDLQDPKMMELRKRTVPYFGPHELWGYSLHTPYIWDWYLQFRFLKWPLIHFVDGFSMKHRHLEGISPRATFDSRRVVFFFRHSTFLEELLDREFAMEVPILGDPVGGEKNPGESGKG